MIEFTRLRLNAHPDLICPSGQALASLILFAIGQGGTFADAVSRGLSNQALLEAETGVHELIEERAAHPGLRRLLFGLFLLTAAERMVRDKQFKLRGLFYGARSQRYLLQAYLWLPKETRTEVICNHIGIEKGLDRRPYVMSWRGVIAAARVAHQLLKNGAELYYPDSATDVNSKVDLVAVCKKGGVTRKLAIQVKSSGVEGTKVVVVESKPSNPTPTDAEREMVRTIEAVWSGVEDLNRQLREHYVPVVVFVNISEAPLDICEDCPTVAQGLSDLCDC